MHENLDLKFSELKDIIGLALDGKLEHVTEKIDGINLVFSFDHTRGLRVARSQSDIVSFGLGRNDLQAKFSDHGGNVVTAFDEGFNVLEKAIELIPEHDRIKIFGIKLNRWFSIEIVYTPLLNTVNYDCNHVVFHELPILELNHGIVARSVNVDLGKLLNVYIKQMQSSLKINNWMVTGPAIVRMKAIDDGSLLTTFINKIDLCMNEAGINDNDTFREYVQGMAMNELNDMKIDVAARRAIAARIAKIPRAMNLIQIKKMVDVGQRDAVDEFIKAEREFRTKWMRPIESAIFNVSLEILKCLQSSLISDNNAEIKRLKDRLTKAIKLIEDSDDEGSIRTLNLQLARLGNIDNVTTSIEGIVFTYKERTYKFTGAFAPLHRIMSLFKFGSMRNIDLDIEEE